jgi:transposase
MEATGVYHQKFAYYLDENGFDVSIVMPNKISNYMRTIENKTITDKTSPEAIAQFG